MILHGIVRFKDGKREFFRVNGYTEPADLPAARLVVENMYRNVQCILMDVPRIPLKFGLNPDA